MITLATLVMLVTYTYGYYPALMHFNTLEQCQAYKTKLEAHNNGRFNGNVIKAEYFCMNVTVSASQMRP